MSKSGQYLTADEAAAMLGIQIASLYAYVSRGLLHSEPDPGNPRARRYLAQDVARLQRRQDARRNPPQAAEPPLAWGGPVLDSAITLLDNGKVYYRGHDASTLAERHPIEAVAGLLWSGSLTPVQLPALSPADHTVHNAVRGGFSADTAETLPQFVTLLQHLSAADLNAYDLRPETVIRQGAAALRHFIVLAAGSAVDEPPARLLQSRWAPAHPEYAALIDCALVLCADHELNASSFTVRCIASTRAPLYAALSGGLAALMGAKHGGASLAVEALIDEVERLGNPQQVLAQRLRRGELLPGFGHRLYPDGDPRAAALLHRIEQVAPDSPASTLAAEISNAARELTGEKPNLELALVTLARLLDQPSGTALTIMALGRTVGWVAHALEEYGRNELIRPRARYTGPAPFDQRPPAG